ncbi:MAG: hypothetical protein DCC55_19415 [Chloroflexi bacterium]|nr:MAG: hypothetical protein DCC55_19415 [Chloroflexota bacterium]
MIVVTKRDLVATVADRWFDTHYGRGRWLHATDAFDPEAIYHALKALPPGADEAAVLAITGQAWWTQNLCEECGADCEVTIGFTQEPHHALDAKYICVGCLERALALGRSAAL